MNEQREADTLSVIVVAGTHSGVGKTTVALGLMASLRARGLTVQPFKVGPDFIDPAHHSAVCGRPSRNLDGWLFSREDNLARFAHYSADADVAVIEGVMGLFDGRSGDSETGSTAEIAKWLGVPVLLVVDAAALARSVGAVVHGFTHFDPDLTVAGVVLNRVGGRGHTQMLEAALAGLPPAIGGLQADDDLTLPERHLGLVMPEEGSSGTRLGGVVESALDLDQLLEFTRMGRPTPGEVASVGPGPKVRIGLARDEAFCFYYPENLELLAEAGATLVEFSPLRDPLPPDLDGLYLGGGYPELHAPALAGNIEALEGVRRLAARGRPVYAECGGLMYLGRSIAVDGATYPLCGVMPFQTRMCNRLSIGYTEVRADSGLFTGAVARGHTFHYSEIAEDDGVPRSYRIVRHGAETAEGYTRDNVLASYVHLHFATSPDLASTFVARCAE